MKIFKIGRLNYLKEVKPPEPMPGWFWIGLAIAGGAVLAVWFWALTV